MYYRRGLRVTLVRGDLEFGPLEELVKQLPSVPDLDLASKEEHVGDIERNIRYLKEKFRQLRHTLPFKQIPGVIIVRMVQVCTMTLNMFPQKGGSRHYSPNMIVTNKGVSMDQLRIRFGSYVQVWEPSTQTNSLKMRRRAAIALGPLQTSTTSYLFMALDTGKVINRAQFTEIPMTAGVIARVNELGSGEPELLPWTNRCGETIGDGPTWNTAVANTKDASMTSDVAGATKDEDDEVVVVAEEDCGDPTTDVNVVDNIAGVDDMRMDTQETYEVWNKEVPEYGVGDSFKSTMTSR